MMKKRFVLSIFILIFIVLSGCSSTSENISKDYEDEIYNISSAIQNYASESDYENKSFDEIRCDVEKLTGSKYVGNIGSGPTILVFQYDEHLEFWLMQIPFESCEFIIDDKCSETIIL